MENLHQKVKAIRLLKGLTQEQVGQQLGTTKANYNRMEKGYVKIGSPKLAKLAEVFGMTPAAITAFESAETQAVSRAEQAVLHVQQELVRAEQTVRHLQQELERVKQDVALARAEKEVIKASTQRYVEQTEALLTESDTFFRYFYQLLLVIPPTEDKEEALAILNTAWVRLVSYSGRLTPEAEQEYLEHRAESPLSSAKQSTLETVALAMRFHYQKRAKVPQED